MKTLGKILKLLVDIPEEDLGTIHDLFERLVAQNKKGLSLFINELKAFLRKEGFDSLIVDGQTDPVNSTGRLLYHERCPDFEFDSELFQLISVDSIDPKPNSIWDIHTYLLSRGLKCANLNLLRFLQFRQGVFPETWKDKKLILLGTIIKEHDPNRAEVDLRAITVFMHYGIEGRTERFMNSHIYMDEANFSHRKNLYTLCFK